MMHIYICTHACTRTYTFAHEHICTCTYTQPNTCMHVHISYNVLLHKAVKKILHTHHILTISHTLHLHFCTSTSMPKHSWFIHTCILILSQTNISLICRPLMYSCLYIDAHNYDPLCHYDTRPYPAVCTHIYDNTRALIA